MKNSVCLLSAVLISTLLSPVSFATAGALPAVQMADPSLTSGVLIPDNNEDLNVRKQLLAHAGTTDPIYFMTYEFLYGESTRDIVKLLGDKAAERKSNPSAAPIIVIIDGHYARPIDNPVERDMLQWLANQGANVFIYNAVPDGVKNKLEQTLVEKTWITHRKMLVVGETLLMGGRNTGPMYLENLDTPEGPRSFVDIDILLRSGIAPDAISQAIAIFTQMRTDKKNAIHLAANQAYEFKSLILPMAGYAPESPQKIPLLPAALPTTVEISSEVPHYQVLKNARNFHIYKSEWNKLPTLPSALDAVNTDEFRVQVRKDFAAEPSGGEIHIETPYFFPDRDTRNIIKDAVKRGVKLRLITNGLGTSDGLSKLIPVLMDSYYQELKALGGDHVQIFMTKNHMLHAKLFAMRSQGKMYIGSHNIHVRSGHFDKEVMLRFEIDPSTFTQPGADPTILPPIDYRLQTWKQLSQENSPNPPLLTKQGSIVDDIVEAYKNPNNFDQETKDFVNQFFAPIIKKTLQVKGGDLSQPETARVVKEALSIEILTGNALAGVPVGVFL